MRRASGFLLPLNAPPTRAVPLGLLQTDLGSTCTAPPTLRGSDMAAGHTAAARPAGWGRLLGCSVLLGLLPAPPSVPDTPVAVPDWQDAGGASVQRGQRLLAQYQCGGCHVIPGVTGADGQRGPTLAGFARRSYIAGALPNDRARLVRWIIDPTALLPETPMPAMGVTPEDAASMAAFLLSLR